ncbi:MAG TPA: D-aminoacylase [Myxococcales bacterium]|nr:D-aminoacylase [Myxococcales bacterium]
MHDLVIKNGTVVDGTGREKFSADISIDDGTITEVGAEVGAGRREIDAEGRLVTPGWVDIHTHYDGQVTWDPHLTPSGWNGVTSVVMGNCGVGFAPAQPERQEWLIQLMEGVEDIPGAALSEGMTWNWETFPEYLDAIDALPHALDFGALIPHGAVRAYVMGERGARNEKASPDDIEQMAEIVREGLRAGAMGFSTSRTILHRAKDGEPVPGTYAGEEELLGIGQAMGDVGAGVFELASDLVEEEKEVAWMHELSKRTGRPVSFNCLQNDIRPAQWADLLKACEASAKDGGRLIPQVAQRPAGLLMGHQGTFHPFMMYEGYRKIVDLPFEEKIAALRQPEVRASILDHPPTVESPIIAMLTQGFHKLFPLGDPPDYEPDESKSVAAIAKREGKTPSEITYDLMMEQDGKELLYFPFLGYTDTNFDTLREMMLHPLTVFGLSDGGAHCGLISDASIPTYLLTHWVRDRTRGERIPLEQIVQLQTQKTAQCYDLLDRGVLGPGMKADLNVIDFDRLLLHPPEMAHDLPTGAARLIQRIEGYDYTVCGGQVTFEDGKPTDARPGRLIRGAQAAPRRR